MKETPQHSEFRGAGSDQFSGQRLIFITVVEASTGLDTMFLSHCITYGIK